MKVFCRAQKHLNNADAQKRGDGAADQHHQTDKKSRVRHENKTADHRREKADDKRKVYEHIQKGNPPAVCGGGRCAVVCFVIQRVANALDFLE